MRIILYYILVERRNKELKISHAPKQYNNIITVDTSIYLRTLKNYNLYEALAQNVERNIVLSSYVIRFTVI